MKRFILTMVTQGYAGVEHTALLLLKLGFYTTKL